MNLNVQGSKNFTLSERMKGHIEKKLEKINYFKSHIKDISFHLDKEKLNFVVNVTILTHKFGTYQLSASDLEMYTAIDKVFHKIDVKINKEKSKIKDHTKASREEMVEFFNQHDEDKPEPTSEIEVDSKPTTLEDAFLHMKDSGVNFHCFTGVDGLSPSFFRKLDDEAVYLFSQLDENTYSEASVTFDGTKVKKSSNVRAIVLRKHTLLSAQKKILEQDYPFDLFINTATDKVSYLFKENNGKWIIMA